MRLSQIGCANSFHANGVSIQRQEFNLIGCSLSIHVDHNTNVARLQAKPSQGLVLALSERLESVLSAFLPPSLEKP